MSEPASQAPSPGTSRLFDRLVSRLRECESVIVAFSGGVDSSLLLKAATIALGPDKALGVSVTGDIFPSWEIETARNVAKEHGLSHRVLVASPMSLQEFADNSPNRCYHCKHFLFSQLLEYARAEGYEHVLEGTNASDVGDHRPGMRATAELGVLTPLKELGIVKTQIRELAHSHGLPNWDEPSAACLASRVPYGQTITPDKLTRIDAGERFLRERFAIRQARVRHDGPAARIEVLAQDISRLSEPESRAAIVAEFDRLGFTYISLDLKGYRTGSLNEVL